MEGFLHPIPCQILARQKTPNSPPLTKSLTFSPGDLRVAMIDRGGFFLVSICHIHTAFCRRIPLFGCYLSEMFGDVLIGLWESLESLGGQKKPSTKCQG